MNKFLEMSIALDIGKKILEEVGTPQELQGKYKEYYEEYIEKPKEDIAYVEKTFDNGKDKLTAIMELEAEILHIECFCRFLQEKKALRK